MMKCARHLAAALCLTLTASYAAPPSEAVEAAGVCSISDFELIVSGREKLPPQYGEQLVGEAENELSDFWRHCCDAAPSLVSTIVAATLLMLGWLIASRLLAGARRRAEKRHDALGGRIFFALANPLLALVAVTLLFCLLLPRLRGGSLYTAGARVYFTAATLLAAAMVMRLISVFSDRMIDFARRDDNNLDALMVDIARKVLKIGFAMLTMFFIGQTIFDLNITALLAGAGVAGLAVAFASRETLANFFGTLVIILDAPFRCGDRVEIGGVDGIVETVGMRSTRIRTRHETLVVMPNRRIAEDNVENISRRGAIRFMFTIPLVYQTKPDQMALAIKTLRDITADFHGPDAPGLSPRVFFDSFAGSGMNLTVIMWLKTVRYLEEEQMRTELNSEILRRFTASGLEFAYDTVTNIVAGDPKRPLVLRGTVTN